MMTREQWKNFRGTLLFRGAVLLLLLYILYHCALALTHRLTTDVVVMGEEEWTVEATGTIFREETVVTASRTVDLIDYLLPDGAKVSTSSTLARLYASGYEEEVRKQAQEDLLTVNRQLFRLSGRTETDRLSQLSEIRQGIRQDLIAGVAAAQNGVGMQEMAETAFDVLMGMERESALRGEGESLATLRAALQTRKMLLLGDARLISTLTSAGAGGKSGYFYYASSVDGYEDVFRRSELQSMSIVAYRECMQMPATSYDGATRVIGKLVCDGEWSLTLPVEEEVAKGLTVGRSYTVRFPGVAAGVSGSAAEIVMTLDRTIPAVGEGQTILVLSSLTMPENFSYTRFQRAQLVIRKTEGYRVPESALTESGGESGVYILDGGRVSFRRIVVDYRGEGYVLVHIPTPEEKESDDGFYTDGGYLSLRDIVITGGTENLYDGKYVD